ncbi:MAG: Ig protein [Herbinix sp.]|jgi:hypothetical protein|nr:Ig protein [Herbinix sp.]
MKRIHKSIYALIITLILTAAPVLIPIQGANVVALAATISISNKSITLEVGQTKTLKISGTSKKITWTSSKKSIASVSSSGKITAKGVGNATITATVSGKKLTCKVTVKEPIEISHQSYNMDIGKTKTLKITGTSKTVAWSSSNKKIATVSSSGKVTAVSSGKATITAAVEGKKLTCNIKVYKDNPYLKNAPFATGELRLSDLSIVIPKDWLLEKDTSMEDEYFAIAAPTESVNGSYVMLYIYDTGEKSPSYKDAKKEFIQDITRDSIQAYYEDLATGLTINVADFKQKDYKANFGETLKSYYILTLGDSVIQESVYSFYLDGYYVELTVADADGEASFAKNADYILNSFMIKK